jgi:hypothetical protein
MERLPKKGLSALKSNTAEKSRSALSLLAFVVVIQFLTGQ